jgi:hypothetical protein
VVTTKYLAKFQSSRAIARPKMIGLEQNVNLICNSSLYTHIPKIKSISPSMVTTNYLAITQSKIIVPERSVNFFCYLSLYTHIPNMKSISQSTVTQSGDNCFISELRTCVALYVRPLSDGDNKIAIQQYCISFYILKYVLLHVCLVHVKMRELA